VVVAVEGSAEGIMRAAEGLAEGDLEDLAEEAPGVVAQAEVFEGRFEVRGSRFEGSGRERGTGI
jgi:hypothetical protein